MPTPSLNLKQSLKDLKAQTHSPAVSIFVPTHRTFPDSEQDPIALKNQLKVAEERLNNEYDKRVAAAIMDNIHAQTDELDHNYNLDTLAVFASEESAQVIRLPFDAKERVIIGEKFATRDMMRNLSEAVNYYVLAITSEQARLIEGTNNRLVKEIKGGADRQQEMSELTFPINNSTLPTGSKADRTGSSDDDKYLKEFFNRVDKSLQEIYNTKPLPVILVADSHNLGYFEKVCDRTDIIIGKVDNIANLNDGKPEDIIAGVQEIVDEKRQTRYEIAKGDLEKARNEKMVRTDLQQIYRSAFEGNAVTLLVRQGYSVPAKIDEQAQTLLVAEDASEEGVTDDAVGEIIELVSHNGGEVVFVPADQMDDKEPIALITRY